MAIVEDINDMGSGLASAIYGGKSKNILKRGVLMELPPNPNIPDGMPMRNPRIIKRMNITGVTGEMKDVDYLNIFTGT